MFTHTIPTQIILYVSLAVNLFWMIVTVWIAVGIFKSAIDLVFMIETHEDFIRTMHIKLRDLNDD
jgi:hypothetical protein